MAGALTAATILIAGPATANAETAQLHVDVSAQKFVLEGNRVVARGPVTASVTRQNGSTETVTKNVTLRAATTKNCRILDLHLAQLYVNLLGLQVRTSEVNVRITGDSKRVLGRLFCKLSEGLKLSKKALAKRSVASLNNRLAGSPLQLLRFNAPVRTQYQRVQQRTDQPSQSSGNDVPPVPPGSCQVLDLMLGPLHLDLLGLIVDLYGPTNQDPVHVLATADPNGGAVGAALCKLAGPYTEGSG